MPRRYFKADNRVNETHIAVLIHQSIVTCHISHAYNVVLVTVVIGLAQTETAHIIINLFVGGIAHSVHRILRQDNTHIAQILAYTYECIAGVRE